MSAARLFFFSWKEIINIIIINGELLDASRTRMELAHFDRVQIQIFFKKADFFRPVLREFMITL